jgi:hypothetical protein
MCAARSFAPRSQYLHGAPPRHTHLQHHLYPHLQHPRPSRSRSVQPNVENVEENNMDTDDHIVPDGTKDVQKISYM